jgi:hypothetical protein
MIRLKFTWLIISLLIFSTLSPAQEKKVRWQKTESEQIDLELLHSTQVLNLPTAETLKKGDFQFEISHRFNTPISSGVSELYGLDGSVTMRLGLGYAFTNRFLVNVARSNLEGNIDTQLKYKLFQLRHDTFPTLITAQAGFAYNGKPVKDIPEGNSKFQYFGSIIFNTLINKNIGIGVVPTYLYNSHIYCPDVQDSFTLGFYVQHYFSEIWSFIFEANPTISGWRDQYDSYAFGVEIETGGHFFKMLLGTNNRMNFPQYIAGAQSKFNSGDWFIGFNITRLLRFW